MRTKLSARLLLVAILLYSSYFLYFNSDYIFKTNQNVTRDKLVETIKYGREFCVGFNVTKGRRTYREDDLEPVTLAVHTTSTYLNYVLEQVANWEGPISVALFVDRQSQKAVDFLYNVYLCDSVFAEKISLHVVYRLAPYSEDCPSFPITPQPCDVINYKYMNHFVNTMISPFGIYPINTMRNVARKGAPTHFQLVSDVEMIFSNGFAHLAKKSANDNLCEDCGNLIVVRRFELEKKVKKVPRTVNDLKGHIDNKTAFEFHHKLFPAGHTIAGLWHWFKVSSNSSQKPSVWEIPYKGPQWEPQLIMHSSAPFSEEDIPTRWRDQQALAYELCRANYTFLLASHLFNVHRGVKKNATILDMAVKNHQARLRDRYLKRYMRRINQVYPNSTSARCGKFTL